MIRTLMFLIFGLILFTSCTGRKSHGINVMTLNIRMDNPADSINAWPNRAHIVSGFVNKRKPDLLGMQEVLWHQYEYLDTTIRGYGSVARGRDDGIEKGEACAVFYNLERFSLLDNGTFWLSETPDVPGSVGWGAALTRIATWARLYDKATNDTVLFFNTHFDHISDSARYMSSGVLLENVIKLSGDNNFIITGDFNATPSSLAIKRMKEGNRAVDSYTISNTRPEGLKYTFNGWKDAPGGGRIDYIFISNAMEVRSHYTWKIIEKGVFISDHWPVTARVTY